MIFTKCEFITEDMALNIYQKIYVSIIWIFVQIPGNFMLYNLIQFDRYGGDYLKRRIIDQVSTYIALYNALALKMTI